MLSWTKLNPTVKISDTKKKFFGKYLYKIIVWCPGSRIIQSKKSKDAAVLLEERIHYLSRLKTYNFGGSWLQHHQDTRAHQLRESAKIEQLQYFIDIKEPLSDQIKLRVEEPTISIYSNDETLLYDLANHYPARLQQVFKPSCDKSIEVLNRGEIIVKKHMDFEYKVTLREFIFSDNSVKFSILDHLYNLDGDSQVGLTKGLVKQLGSTSGYFSGGYFYAKDVQTVTFVNLICPGLISGIFKLTKIEQ